MKPIFYYVVVETQFNVTMNYPYYVYNDIVRYYNVASDLHKHESVTSHYTLAVL